MYKSNRQEFVTIIIILYNYIAAYCEPWHTVKKVYQEICRYSGTFSDIQPCSDILRDIKAYSDIKALLRRMES